MNEQTKRLARPMSQIELQSEMVALSSRVEVWEYQIAALESQLAALLPKPAPAPEPEVGEPDTSKWPECLQAAYGVAFTDNKEDADIVRLNLSIAAKMINDAKAKAEVVDTRNYAGSEPVAQREVILGTGKISTHTFEKAPAPDEGMRERATAWAIKTLDWDYQSGRPWIRKVYPGGNGGGQTFHSNDLHFAQICLGEAIADFGKQESLRRAIAELEWAYNTIDPKAILDRLAELKKELQQ